MLACKGILCLDSRSAGCGSIGRYIAPKTCEARISAYIISYQSGFEKKILKKEKRKFVLRHKKNHPAKLTG